MHFREMQKVVHFSGETNAQLHVEIHFRFFELVSRKSEENELPGGTQKSGPPGKSSEDFLENS